MHRAIESLRENESRAISHSRDPVAVPVIYERIRHCVFGSRKIHRNRKIIRHSSCCEEAGGWLTSGLENIVDRRALAKLGDPAHIPPKLVGP